MSPDLRMQLQMARTTPYADIMRTALDDISALRGDMDDVTGGSTYGQQVKTRNLALLKTLSAALLGLSGLRILLAIFVT